MFDLPTEFSGSNQTPSHPSVGISLAEFKPLLLGPSGLPGMEYKKIKIRFGFDVKPDGRRKGRLVARGDMTPEPDEAVYSSVATLCSLRIVIFLAELNGLNLMQRDVGNAYLESYTQEKVYFIAGAKFGHHAGTTFVIEKVLYRLCSSGL